MRVFSILAVGMGLVFTGFAAFQYTASPDALLDVAGYATIAVLSFVAAFERLSHRPAFFLAAVLAVALWWTADPAHPWDLDDPLGRRRIGLGLALGWMLVMALVAQRVSARRLIQGA
ncbi:MAG: hypothetical protein AAF602_24925 [Myxococcota bacterium]